MACVFITHPEVLIDSSVPIEERDAVAFVSHGGVGGLLLGSLTSHPIDRRLDQPGMGSYFTFDAAGWRALSQWRRIE